jgi:hypothetical protein
MGHTPRRISIVAAAAAAVAGLVWVLMSANPPGSAPTGPSTTPATTNAAIMPKAIATADQPAIVTVARPSGATRSLSPATSLQITVRPEAVERGEPYLVNVYAVPADKAGTAKSDSGGETLVGSFSFFPPPRAGETRTFTLPTPSGDASAGPDLTLRVELVPAAPDAKLEKSTLAVIDAKIDAE